MVVRIGIGYEEQIMEAGLLAQPDVGDVGHPQLVDARGLKVLAQIGIYPKSMIRECGACPVYPLFHQQIMFP